MKTIIRIGFLLAFLLSDTQIRAQSKAAYLKAGDECLTRNDPFCARSNYRLALDFSEEADVYFRLGAAERALHNYGESQSWYQRGLAKCKKDEEKIEALYVAADLYKRTGAFEAAQKCLDALKIADKGNEKKWEKVKSDYQKAAALFHDSAAYELTVPGGNINTAYSDFAPAALGDSFLFFSSLRYFIFDADEKVATSRIATSVIKKDVPEKPKLLDESINQPAFNNANASISPDGKIMIFTRCLYDDKGKLNCALYESVFENGMWQDGIKLNAQINPPGKTATQPCISTNKTDGYLLFFSSNKSGGAGGMDIWTCKRNANGKYESPENTGKSINSAQDEWSPFYDAETDSLYFSTEKDEGLGGLDLYSISFSKRNTNMARCLEPPFNSGYNDLYYSRSYGDKSHRYIVTNRPPSIRLNGSSCCYDIFRITATARLIDTVIVIHSDKKDSTLAVIDRQTEFSKLNFTEKIQNINQDFPIRLYFDNDHPDPRSILNTTQKNYKDLVLNYLIKSSVYKEKQPDEIRKKLITAFFRDSVSANFDRLELFTIKLFELLNSQASGIKITIQGSASPLAERRYNLILSSRRIESLLNYWKQWRNGIMNNMLSEQKLEIEFIPAGEEKSPAGISDDFSDQVKSVFSKEAALERRIELVNISAIK